MAGFEASVQVALDDLCEDCPLRNLCGQVEMARLEADSYNGDNIDGQLAAIEADVAGDIVMASIYKARKGCEGAEQHDQVCHVEMIKAARH